jgi:arsenate reductase
MTIDVTIYHNPDCGTSRNVLAMIRNAGIEPTVIEYLKNPPDREQLIQMITSAGLTVRAAIREKGTPYNELGLEDLSLTDDTLLDAMMTHPILINRPFVITPLGTRLARPSEVVLDILPDTHQGAFTKEDGQPSPRRQRHAQCLIECRLPPRRTSSTALLQFRHPWHRTWRGSSHGQANGSSVHRRPRSDR